MQKKNRKHHYYAGLIKQSKGEAVRLSKKRTAYFKEISTRIMVPLNVVFDCALNELISKKWNLVIKSNYASQDLLNRLKTKTSLPLYVDDGKVTEAHRK